jgi:Leucine-rich repeat (LRR) protein
MKLKLKLVIIFSLLFCFSVEGQQDTTNYIYQRTYKRLKDKGLFDSEIKKYIKESDSLNIFLLKQEMQRMENEYLARNPSPLPSSSSNCIDIPATEKAVLLAIYQNLNGSAWATGWDFNQPVTSWNGTTGWKGVTVNNCHVEGLLIISNSLIGEVPNLSPLKELKNLSLINNDYPLYSCPCSNIAMTAGSNFNSIGSLDKLEILNISNADFNGSMPASFLNLSAKIKQFSLLNCRLSDFSQLNTIISEFHELELLNLSVNYIGPNSSDFPIPQSFGNLTNLKYLIFVNSRINDFNPLTSLTNLKNILLTKNSITGSIPDLSNLEFLNTLWLDDNELTGALPQYFEQFNFGSLLISNNNLQGNIPSININPYHVGGTKMFYFDNNFFRFKDFVDEFDYYNNFQDLFFRYSPQAKTDNIETINAGAGQPITLTMCQDGNFHPNDSYKWYRNGSPISGAESREYTFTASTASAGVYHCRSQHFNPPMTNNSTNVNKNLTLYRNDITVNVVNAPPPCVDCTSFDLLLGKKYIITGWVNAMKDTGSDYEKLNVFDYDKAKIAVTFLAVGGSVIGSPLIFNTSGEIIDGWQKISGEFIVPNNIDDIKIELVNDYSNSISTFFDDIRVHPVEGNMKSFVYNQATQKLMAELDENNYATFYEYDKEGGLVRVKKETEKGINTIQETRSSTKKTGN